MAAHHPSWTLSYRERASLATAGPLASYLLRLISIKQTNLCLSADVETSAELLALAEEVGDSICILKTHCDIVTDWTDRTAKRLQEIARRKWFLVFEDRKFADIGGMSCRFPLHPMHLVYSGPHYAPYTCTRLFASPAFSHKHIKLLIRSLAYSGHGLIVASQAQSRSSTHQATIAYRHGLRLRTRISCPARPSLQPYAKPQTRPLQNTIHQ